MTLFILSLATLFCSSLPLVTQFIVCMKLLWLVCRVEVGAIYFMSRTKTNMMMQMFLRVRYIGTTCERLLISNNTTDGDEKPRDLGAPIFKTIKCIHNVRGTL